MTYTKAGSTFTEIILEIFRFNGALIEVGDKLIKDLGLTSARWQVLGSLDKEALTVAEIARRMGLSRQNVQRIANNLKKDGFLDTSPNPAHMRAKLYFLTDSGLKGMKEVNKRQEEWVNEMSRNMENNQLQHILKKLIGYRQRVESSIEGIGWNNEK